MQKIKIKANAKVNFTLDITGTEGGYHNLSSLVSTIDVSDTIVVKKRKDDKIVLKVKGDAGCALEDNNAYKAGKLFKKTFNVSGFNVYLTKKIPVGGGIGGSSADIAGVLKALKILFSVKEDVIPLANKLGSDSGFLVEGGYGVLNGRGDVFTKINCKEKFYLILCLENGSVSSKEAYKIYDEQGKTYTPTTDKAVKALTHGDKVKFYTLLKNDLYNSAIKILPQIKENLNYLCKFAPSFMTGSGSITCALFTDKKQRDSVYKTLKKHSPKKYIKTETV